jgi:hypothetical protein
MAHHSSCTETLSPEHTNSLIATLGAGNTTRFELWNCTVRAFDGVHYSSYESANKNISNTLPVEDTPTITPETPNELDNLTCNWNNALDGDNDPISNITVWYRNNHPLAALYLPFEGGSTSSETQDYSGNGNNAEVTGASWQMSGGKVGGYYDFGGGGENYMTIPDSPSLNITGDITLEMWGECRKLRKLARFDN